MSHNLHFGEFRSVEQDVPIGKDSEKEPMASHQVTPPCNCCLQCQLDSILNHCHPGLQGYPTVHLQKLTFHLNYESKIFFTERKFLVFYRQKLQLARRKARPKFFPDHWVGSHRTLVRDPSLSFEPLKRQKSGKVTIDWGRYLQNKGSNVRE